MVKKRLIKSVTAIVFLTWFAQPVFAFNTVLTDFLKQQCENSREGTAELRSIHKDEEFQVAHGRVVKGLKDLEQTLSKACESGQANGNPHDFLAEVQRVQAQAALLAGQDTEQEKRALFHAAYFGKNPNDPQSGLTPEQIDDLYFVQKDPHYQPQGFPNSTLFNRLKRSDFVERAHEASGLTAVILQCCARGDLKCRLSSSSHEIDVNPSLCQPGTIAGGFLSYKDSSSSGASASDGNIPRGRNDPRIHVATRHVQAIQYTYGKVKELQTKALECARLRGSHEASVLLPKLQEKTSELERTGEQGRGRALATLRQLDGLLGQVNELAPYLSDAQKQELEKIKQYANKFRPPLIPIALLSGQEASLHASTATGHVDPCPSGQQNTGDKVSGALVEQDQIQRKLANPPDQAWIDSCKRLGIPDNQIRPTKPKFIHELITLPPVTDECQHIMLDAMKEDAKGQLEGLTSMVTGPIQALGWAIAQPIIAFESGFQDYVDQKHASVSSSMCLPVKMQKVAVAEIERYKCLNDEERSKVGCKLAGIFTSESIGFLAMGAHGAQAVPLGEEVGAGARAATSTENLVARLQLEKLNPDLRQRLARAEELLEKNPAFKNDPKIKSGLDSLYKKLQANANNPEALKKLVEDIDKIHAITDEGTGAYAAKTIAEKARLAKELGFSDEERAALIRLGVTGDDARMPTLHEAAIATQNPVASVPYTESGGPTDLGRFPTARDPSNMYFTGRRNEGTNPARNFSNNPEVSKHFHYENGPTHIVMPFDRDFGDATVFLPTNTDAETARKLAGKSYNIGSKPLSEGAFSVVYKATPTQVGKPVEVVKLRKPGTNAERYLERDLIVNQFAKQAAERAIFEGKPVVRVAPIRFQNGALFQEFVDGPSLIDLKKYLEAAEKSQCVGECSEVLRRAHIIDNKGTIVDTAKIEKLRQRMGATEKFCQVTAPDVAKLEDEKNLLGIGNLDKNGNVKRAGLDYNGGLNVRVNLNHPDLEFVFIDP